MNNLIEIREKDMGVQRKSENDSNIWKGGQLMTEKYKLNCVWVPICNHQIGKKLCFTTSGLAMGKQSLSSISDMNVKW